MINPTHKTAAFKKELDAFRARWPDVQISTRDRAKFNETMLGINKKARKRQKRKKRIAT